MKSIFLSGLLAISFGAFAQSGCDPNTNSLSFNGFSDYVDVVNSTGLAIDSNLTVEAWINPSSFASTPAQGTIFCKHGWSQGEGGYVLRAGGSGQVSFNIAGLDINGNPTSWEEVISPTNSINSGTWSHVAGVFTQDTLSLYINGQLVAQTPFTGSVFGSTYYSPKIGRLSDTFGGRYWNGLLDEVRVWNRGLSAAEVVQNMNSHVNPASNGLIAYWRFNEGAGSMANDLTGNGSMGTLIAPVYSNDVPFTSGTFTAWVSVSPSDTICAGTQASYTAFPQGINYTYQWSNGLSGWLLNTAVAGDYYVIVTDSSGCSDTSETHTLVLNNAPPVPVITLSGSTITASNVQGAYQWFVNGNTLSDDLVISNAANGTYYLMITDTITGCFSVSDTLLLNTSIHEYGHVFSLSPNPAADNIKLKMYSFTHSGTWELHDASGRMIRSGPLATSKDGLIIPLDGLEDGTYFLSVFESNTRAIQRFVKSSR